MHRVLEFVKKSYWLWLIVYRFFFSYQPFKRSLAILSIALLYYGSESFHLGWISLSTGLAVGCCIRFGPYVLLGISTAAFLNAHWLGEQSWLLSLFWAIFVSAQVGLAYFLANRYVVLNHVFDESKTFLSFLVWVVLLPSAMMGFVELAYTGFNQNISFLPLMWLSLFLKYALGILIATPLVLGLGRSHQLLEIPYSWHLTDTLALLAGLLVSAFGLYLQEVVFIYLLLPVLVYMAVRFYNLGVVLASVYLILVSMGFHVLASGPFQHISYFLNLQIFLTLALVAISLFSLLYQERDQAYQELHESRIDFEQNVNRKVDEITRQKNELLIHHIQIDIQKESLKKLNSLKDKLFSIISHDLRSPLTTLQGFIHMLSTFKAINESEQKMILERVDERLSLSLDLLDNLLLWTSSQMNQLKIEPAPHQLLPLVDENIRLLKILADKKQINLERKVSAGIQIYADLNMTKSVLRNLISNAIKFTPEGGRIDVEASTRNGYVEISVRDSGIGIPQEQQKKLFSGLEHFSTPGTNNEKGTGLGLILCKEFVENNHGRIWVTSKKSEGSTFAFTLPRA